MAQSARTYKPSPFLGTGQSGKGNANYFVELLDIKEKFDSNVHVSNLAFGHVIKTFII